MPPLRASHRRGFRGVDNGYHKMLYYTYNGGMHVEERRLGKDLTVSLIKWYTMYIMEKLIMMKTIKELGLLDADFLQGMTVFLLPVLLKVIT